MHAMESGSELSCYGECPRVQQCGTIFLLLPPKEETDAEEFERLTLSITGARLVKIGSQLVVCRHGCGGASCGGARGCGAVRIARRGGGLPPLPSDGRGDLGPPADYKQNPNTFFENIDTGKWSHVKRWH